MMSTYRTFQRATIGLLALVLAACGSPLPLEIAAPAETDRSMQTPEEAALTQVPRATAGAPAAPRPAINHLRRASKYAMAVD